MAFERCVICNEPAFGDRYGTLLCKKHYGAGTITIMKSRQFTVEMDENGVIGYKEANGQWADLKDMGTVMALQNDLVAEIMRLKRLGFDSGEDMQKLR